LPEQYGYRDKQGRLLFVSSGIGQNHFGTFYRKSPKLPSIKRFKSPALPMRDTQEEAERDLDRYARLHGLRPDAE